MVSLDSPDAAKVAMSAIIYVVGMVGNVLVIFMILYLKETKKISHWYILQLAISDILFLQSLPFYMVDVIEQTFSYPAWFCKLTKSVLFINYYGSIIFLAIMAIDRYVAVCHGLSKFASRFRSHFYCYTVTLLAWMAAVLLSIPVMLYADLDGSCECQIKFPADKSLYCANILANASTCDSRFADFLAESECSEDVYQFEDYGYDGSGLLDEAEGYGEELCHHPPIFPGFNTLIYFNFSVMFVLPLTIISICYGLIVIHLRNTKAKLRRNSDKSDSSGHSSNENSKLRRDRSKRRKSSSSGQTDKHKTRITVMCAVLVILFLVCWLPYHAVKLSKIGGFVSSTISCDGADTIALLLVYVNSALNPYLYNFLGTFRMRMRQIRKHRRTKEFLGSIRWTKERRFSGRHAAESAKFSDGVFLQTQISATKDEASPTQGDGNKKHFAHSQELQKFE